jgi:hypothetical protein
MKITLFDFVRLRNRCFQKPTTEVFVCHVAIGVDFSIMLMVIRLPLIGGNMPKL